MKSGAKGTVKAVPLDFSDYPEDRAERRLRFIAEYLLVPKGVGAGKPVRLRDFQTDIIRGAFAPGIRTGLVSVARANGKTGLAAMLAVAELFVGPDSAEVLVVASDQRQAGITLRMAKRMIELTPKLEERAQLYADKIVVPHNDSMLLPLPAEPGALHGHDPSLLVVDELHVVTEAVWEAVTSVSGKRPESLTLAISTPSSSPDCIMWRLVEHGRMGDDPAFYLKEFALFPLLHPAAALHQAAMLPPLREDFQKLKEFLDRHSKAAEPEVATSSNAARTVQIERPAPAAQQMDLFGS